MAMHRHKLVLEKQLLETKLEALELADRHAPVPQASSSDGAASLAAPDDDLIPAVHDSTAEAS